MKSQLGRGGGHESSGGPCGTAEGALHYGGQPTHLLRRRHLCQFSTFGFSQAGGRLVRRGSAVLRGEVSHLENADHPPTPPKLLCGKPAPCGAAISSGMPRRRGGFDGICHRWALGIPFFTPTLHPTRAPPDARTWSCRQLYAVLTTCTSVPTTCRFAGALRVDFVQVPS